MRRNARASRRASQQRSAFSRAAALLAGGFLFEADSVTTPSGGTFASFIDKLDSTHLLTQSTAGKQCATPAANAVLNNALTASFTGTKYYLGSRATSYYKLLSNGSTYTLVFIAVTQGTAGAAIALATTQTAAQPGINLSVNNGLSQASLAIYGVGVTALNTSARAVAAPGAKNALRFDVGTALTPDLTFSVNGSSVFSGNYTGSIGTGSSEHTLVIGAKADGTNGAVFDFGALAVAPRALTAADLATLQSYFGPKYGVTL